MCLEKEAYGSFKHKVWLLIKEQFMHIYKYKCQKKMTYEKSEAITLYRLNLSRVQILPFNVISCRAV